MTMGQMVMVRIHRSYVLLWHQPEERLRIILQTGVYTDRNRYLLLHEVNRQIKRRQGFLCNIQIIHVYLLL